LVWLVQRSGHAIARYGRPAGLLTVAGREAAPGPPHSRPVVCGSDLPVRRQ
jgi:hypothetical protein